MGTNRAVGEVMIPEELWARPLPHHSIRELLLPARFYVCFVVCGFSITASHVKNRFGARYTYYHCSKRRPDYRCRQPYVSLPELERQILGFLGKITIPDSIHEWSLRRLEAVQKQKHDDRALQTASAEKTRETVAKQLDTLTKLRLRDLVTDAEYLQQRRELERETLKLDQTLVRMRSSPEWFEPAALCFSFSNRAVSRFQAGDAATKRLILEITGLNPTLKDRQLNIDAKKPFRRWSKPSQIPDLRRGRDSNSRCL